MENFKCVIFDVDGILEYRDEVYPGAPELISFLRDKNIIVKILTNSTLKSRKSCTKRLKAKGFEILESEVVTASSATALYLKKNGAKSCWPMIDGDGVAEFADFKVDKDHPDYVLVGDYRKKFNFENLNRAFRALHSGSKLIIMIPELIDTTMGELELNVGAWGEMLQKASGAETINIGKPNRYVFELTLDGIDIPKNQILMVGDKVITDIQGAKNFGIKSALIKAGEFQEKDLSSSTKADYIFENITGLKSLFI